MGARRLPQLPPPRQRLSHRLRAEESQVERLGLRPPPPGSLHQPGGVLTPVGVDPERDLAGEQALLDLAQRAQASSAPGGATSAGRAGTGPRESWSTRRRSSSTSALSASNSLRGTTSTRS